MFKHLCVILFMGWGWLPSMHHRKHYQHPDRGGLASQHTSQVTSFGLYPGREGVCIQGQRGLHPGIGVLPTGEREFASRGGGCADPAGTMTVGGTHPTGMLPCL